MQRWTILIIGFLNASGAIPAILILLGLTNVLYSQEIEHPSFRIDTDIYVDLKQPPIQQTVTLFQNGICYDFGSDETGLTTIVDAQQQKIFVLDAKRKLKTEVSMVALQAEIDQALAQAPESMKQVTVEEWSVDDQQLKQLTVGNEDFRYITTVVQPQNAKAATQYATFADWSARLNAAHPPKIPPYIRLRLNRALAEQSFLPKRITRVSRQNTIYANVVPTWQLSSDDRKRIETAMQSQKEFVAVTPNEFWAK